LEELEDLRACKFYVPMLCFIVHVTKPIEDSTSNT